MLAHFSQDPALQAAFREGTDIHTAVAAEIFGVAESAVGSDMRRIAKAVNFGVIYGQSPFGLAAVLSIPQPEAAHFIESYFARYAGVDRYLAAILTESAATGYARTILGRRRPIEGIRTGTIYNSGPYRQRNLAERTAHQFGHSEGSAADLIKKAMLNLSAPRLAREKSPAKMLLQIHDELVFDVPADKVANRWRKLSAKKWSTRLKSTCRSWLISHRATIGSISNRSSGGPREARTEWAQHYSSRWSMKSPEFDQSEYSKVTGVRRGGVGLRCDSTRGPAAHVVLQ